MQLLWHIEISAVALEFAVLTAPPAIELILQPGDGVSQRLVFFLLLLPLFLPLLCSQFNIQSHCVLNGFCSGERELRKRQRVQMNSNCSTELFTVPSLNLMFFRVTKALTSVEPSVIQLYGDCLISELCGHWTSQCKC